MPPLQSFAGLTATLATVFFCMGCVGGPRNPSCGWSEEPARPLDLSRAADRRHLNGDARAAEERAIRHADAARGHRSGDYAGPEEYRRSRERCLAVMVGEIADRHRIQAAQVAASIGQRDERLDALVLFLFTALFGFAAHGLARRVLARFQDERWLALTGAAAAAVFISAAGVMIGGLGASLVEMIQLGDTHLSYRADRTPWAQHQPLFFLGGIVLFSVIAALRWFRDQRAG